MPVNSDSCGSWPVQEEAVTSGFTFLRVMQTGPNSRGGDLNFMMAGFEVYGMMFHVK